ncbi:GIY-YIG nuclease family protein [Sphingomonas sp. 35-24ZXX]|uniref:GIY-YIG nuclease family protein n=1 Tax=Sphingomonas sp. 35-24ZXX TaxID=1545915 RepID=UPI0009E08F6C|nr:GIY-YIG nuclease family protein [Sphingomonas sp. 35-24ZXX]
MALEELKDTFNVFSDDPNEMDYIYKHADIPDDFIENMIKKIEEYNPLFELLFAVPSCLSLMDGDDVGLERHPTKLRLEPKGTDAKCASQLSIKEAPRYVTVTTLYDLGGDPGASREISPSNLKIETSGYWRTLEFGQTGADKSGNPVQGKSWVNHQKSWIETETCGHVSPFETGSIIEPLSSENLGWIYVLRNATHPRDVYKIGYTTVDVDARASQLSGTSGQPDIFGVMENWKVKEPRLIESEIHDALKAHRVNIKREFFQLKYDRIRQIIVRIIEKYGALVDA